MIFDALTISGTVVAILIVAVVVQLINAVDSVQTTEQGSD